MKIRKGGFGPKLIKRYGNNIELSKREGVVTFMDLILYYEDKPRIIEKILRMRKIRETLRKKGKKDVRKDKDGRDYPAMICRCYPAKCIDNKMPLVTFFGHSKGNNKMFYRDPQLLNKMNQIGGVGNHSTTKCKNPIGQCAEQHAAQFLLNKEQCRLNEIIYSTPIRPRDNSTHDYCNNCKYILGL